MPQTVLQSTSTPSPGVTNRGFVALLATMTCGALNDNMLRGAMMISVAASGMWSGQLGDGGTGWVGAMLYLPFILLLGFTGQLADRFAKRRIIIATRMAEVVLTLGVTMSLWFESLVGTSVLFVLLAAQSAFFSPAKYGSVPELVGNAHLSRANGILSLLTNLAIILGMAVAGFILESGPVVLGLVMVGVAFVGLVSSLLLPRRPAADATLHVSSRTFSAHVPVLKAMRGTPLMTAMVSWCWFYAIGSLIISIVPNWREIMHLDDAQAGGLLAAPAVGIALGGVIAGFGSGLRIRPSILLVGAGGMCGAFLALGLVPAVYNLVFALLIVAGAFAGMYVIPLLAMLQHLPSPEFRARVVGTSNFMTYLAMVASAIVFGVVAPVTTSAPANWFLVCSAAMAIVFVGTMMGMGRLNAGASPKAACSVGAPS